MTTLLTGGSSQVGVVLARLLQSDGRQVLFASRSGKVPSGFDAVVFDWYDPTTFENPFKGPNGSTRSFEGIYLLPPTKDIHPDKAVVPFIDLAISKGVKRFVLLSGSTADKSLAEKGVGLAIIHKHLEDKGTDYFVVRPSWFMENFQTAYGYGIRTKSEFVTSVPTGKIPFIAVADIAQAAYEAIVSTKNDVSEKIIIGSELLTYDQAADILSEALGRKITHRSVSKEELIQLYQSFGLPADYSTFLATLESYTEGGSQEKVVNLDPKILYVGKVTFKEWAEANKASLAP